MYAAPVNTPENVTKSALSMLSSYMNSNQRTEDN